MKFEITGTLKGKSGRWAVEASSEESARQKAIQSGVSITSVEPVGSELAVAGYAPPQQVTVTPSPITCGNCGRVIGRLEQPWNYLGQNVCAECASRLMPQEPAPPPQWPAVASVTNVAISAASPRRKTQTIEMTSKLWKGQQLLAFLLCVIAVFVIYLGANSSQGGPLVAGTVTETGAGIIILGIGLVWFVVARIGAWWFHG